MKTEQEMEEALKAGYTLYRSENGHCLQMVGEYLVLFGGACAIFQHTSTRTIEYKEWQIQRPDLTKPQIVNLDHKGWAWDNYPEEAEERCLLSIMEDGLFRCWADGKTSENFGFNSNSSFLWKNFSWEKPKPKKREITLTLTEDQIEAVEEMLRGRK
jgi:hypothetical protein